MKYVLGLILGLAAGILTAGAVIYFNPLTQNSSAAAKESDWILGYSLAASDNWLSTHDRRLDLPIEPADVPLLWEDGIKGTLLTAMPLNSQQNSSGIAATRISVPSARSEFIRAGILVDDYWLISVPGEGSVFVHSVNNQWPLLRDTLVRVDWLQRDWAGPGKYDPTQGPDDSGARVSGLTGRFVGAQGRAHEQVSLDAYNGSLAQLSGQLLIDVTDGQL
jgi:hypothetical protein